MRISNPLASNPFKEFSNIYSLVYSSKFEEDAHTIVRGVTLSNEREDSDLVQGHLDGLDIQLLARKVLIHKPGGQKHKLAWSIMHVSLPKGVNLPHIFLDGNNRYHEDVYETIFTKFQGLILANMPYTNGFTVQYRTFCNAETTPELETLLPVTLTDMLSTLGHFMDYEVIENNIYVYLPKIAENQKDLEQMLAAAKALYTAYYA